MAIITAMAACSSPAASVPSATDGSGSAGNPGGQVAAAERFVTGLALEAPLAGRTQLTVPRGKKLGILSCTQSAASCRTISEQAAAAAESLGWTATIVDGQLSAARYATGLSQLISAHVNAIISVAASDAATPNAHAAAAAAHIPIVCVFCGNTLVSAIKYPSAANVDVDYHEQGKATATYLTWKSGGHAKVAVLSFDLSSADQVRVKSFESSLTSMCSGCSIVSTTPVPTGADLVTATRQVATGLLSRYGTGQLDYIVTPADSFSPGAVQAITLAGRNDVKVVGYDCDPSALAAIRAGSVEIGCADTPLAEAGWAAVDTAARLLVDGHASDATIPFAYVTPQTVPSAGKSVTTFGFEGYFRKLWGV
jgi:ribose transport system substrate-binding protein